MKKLILFTFLIISVLGSIRAQDSTVTIPHDAISVYGTVETEVMYDGDYLFIVKISEGSLTNVNRLWINAGSDGEDMNTVDCTCEEPMSFEEGDKFIALVIKSKRSSYNHETGSSSWETIYRPILMRKL